MYFYYFTCVPSFSWIISGVCFTSRSRNFQQKSLGMNFYILSYVKVSEMFTFLWCKKRNSWNFGNSTNMVCMKSRITKFLNADLKLFIYETTNHIDFCNIWLYREAMNKETSMKRLMQLFMHVSVLESSLFPGLSMHFSQQRSLNSNIWNKYQAQLIKNSTITNSKWNNYKLVMQI